MLGGGGSVEWARTLRKYIVILGVNEAKICPHV